MAGYWALPRAGRGGEVFVPLFRVGRAGWKGLFAGTAVPQDLALVLEDVAAAVFVAGHAESELFVTPAPEFEPSADWEFKKGSSHNALMVDG